MILISPEQSAAWYSSRAQGREDWTCSMCQGWGCPACCPDLELPYPDYPDPAQETP